MGDFYELFFEDAVVAARALDLTLTSAEQGIGRRDPHGGRAAPRGQLVHPAAARAGLQGRDLRADGRPVEGEGDRPARGRARRHARASPTTTRARGAREPLPRRRRRRRGRVRDRGARSVDRRALGVRGGGRAERRSRSSCGSIRARCSPGRARTRIAAGFARRGRAPSCATSRSGRSARTRWTSASTRCSAKGRRGRACASVGRAARGGAVRRAWRAVCEPGRKLPVARLVELRARRDARARRGDAGAPRARAHDGRRDAGLAPRPDRRDEDRAGRAPASPTSARAAHRRRGDPPPARRRRALRHPARPAHRGARAPREGRRRRAPRGEARGRSRGAARSRRAADARSPSSRSSRARSEQCPDPTAREALGGRGRAAVDRRVRATCTTLLAARGRRRAARCARATAASSATASTRSSTRRARSRSDGQRLIVELEARLRESAQIPSLKLRYTRVFGWYIEVTRSHVEQGARRVAAQADHRDRRALHVRRARRARRQARARRGARGGARGGALRGARAASSRRTHERLRAVAHAPRGVGRRERARGGRAPRRLRAPDGRRLARARRSRTRATPSSRSSPRPAASCPNDVTLDASADARGGRARRARFWLVTGPEHGRASRRSCARSRSPSSSRRSGSFVPARRARIGVVDRVLTRVGASDNLARGESTFMVEMKETANVAAARHAPLARRPRRDWPRHEHLRRPRDRVGGRRAPARRRRLPRALRDALPRAHRARGDAPAGCENWSVTAREHAGDVVFFHKLAARGGVAELRRRVRAARGGARAGARARAGDPRRSREGRGAPRRRARVAARERSRAGDRSSISFGGGRAGAGAPGARACSARVDVDRLTPLEALPARRPPEEDERRDARRARERDVTPRTQRRGRLRARRGGRVLVGDVAARPPPHRVGRRRCDSALESTILMAVLTLVSGAGRASSTACASARRRARGSAWRGSASATR